MNTSNIWNISQLKAAVKAEGSHFFDAASMRFFNSRIAPGVKHTDAGIVFITSEQFDSRSPRLYTIRIAKADGSIDEVGEFQQYKTLDAARKAVRAL